MVSQSRDTNAERRRQSDFAEVADAAFDVAQDAAESELQKISSEEARVAAGGPSSPTKEASTDAASSAGSTVESKSAHKDHIVIALTKRVDGFGFNIVGGTDQTHIPTDNGVFVSMIRPGGAAAVDGRLKIGHKILSVSYLSFLKVNGIDLAGLTHDEVVAIFRQAKGDSATFVVDTKAEDRSILPETAPKFPSLFSRLTSSEPQQKSPMTASNALQLPTVSVAPSKENDDAESVTSYAPSTHSVVDDVPRTPKKPLSILDPRNPSVVTEVLFVSIGLAAVAVGIVVVYKLASRRK